MRLVVGRIVRPHGIRGEVVVEVLSDHPGRFAGGADLDVGDPEKNPLTRRVVGAREHQGRLLVRFEDITDRNQAEALRGTLLSIPDGAVAPLEQGRYYPHDLEGMAVVDESGTELGVMTAVLENPANDIWVVRANDKDVLVPAVKEIVVDVDVGAKRIVLRPIPGLFD